MSGSGHSNRKHRRRNPIDRFFDLLRGKSTRRSHHHSEFPGINLPKDYNPETAQKLKEDKPEIMKSEDGTDFQLPEIPQKILNENKSQLAKRNKTSLFSRIDYYFKTRALRREERRKNKFKRNIRQKRQAEYRKQEKGRTIRQKLLNETEPGEVSREKKIPFFSQRNSLFRNLTITVNSTLIFITTYIIAYLFYWITCLLVASWYGLDSTLYFYDLKFNDHSQVWSRFNILMVTGIPPFLSLILGLWLFKIVFKMSRFVSLQKLFILWLAFHLFNHFFGAFPSGIVTDEGFGYVAAWLYMNTAFKFMFSLVSLFILGLIGYYSAERILETSDSMSRVKSENRMAFILTQVAIPWLIGTVVILLARIPENFNYPYETLMLFSMVFVIIPPFFNEKVKPKLNLVKIKKRRHVNLGYLAMMIVFLAFLRIMLGIGLHFVVRLEISISPAFN